jgi:hypothetical protein
MIARVRINENGEAAPKKIKRVRLKEPEAPNSKSLTPAVMRRTLFGEPQLLAGEDPAKYEELLARIRAAVKPVDIIDEMYIADGVCLEWDVLRWRRFKLILLQRWGLERVESFLAEKLDLQHFAEHLIKSLHQVLPKDKAEDLARTVKHECAQNESDAVDKIAKVLARRTDLDVEEFLDDARRLKAAELAQQYVRRELDAVTLVDGILTDAGMSMDAFVADALAERSEEIQRLGVSTIIERVDRLTTIERIDRLIRAAEGARDAALREIERHRAVLGEAMRRTVQEVEDAEFQVIETPANGESAA